MPLTDAQVRQTKPAEKTYKLSDEKGLYLEVTLKGAKRWRFKYRFGGKEKRISQGPIPTPSSRWHGRSGTRPRASKPRPTISRR